MINLAGYKLTFDEEFNQRSISFDGAGTTWADTRSAFRDVHADVGFGRSSFVDASSGYDPFLVKFGALSITAVPDRTPYGYPGAWESGLITTEGDFSQTYGYFEVRADFSHQPGGWDAFWLLPVEPKPDPNNAGRWQELDVVEHYGDGPKSVYSGIHTTDSAPNQDWQRFLQLYSEMPNSSGYHTYGMDWELDIISFYVDGQLIGSKSTPSDMHGAMYLVADLATQGYGTNNADLAGAPITSHFDYVRVFSKDPLAKAVMQDVVSAPDMRDPGLYGAQVAGPATPTGTGAGSSPSSLTIGAGTQQLVLRISEDAYQGDAQYTVSVDGHQIGGTQTAHSSHAAVQSDIVTVLGDWTTGDHTVRINFLNDAWGFTFDTDRNLYLDGASYGGAPIANSHLAFMGAGPQEFDFHLGSSTPATPTSPVLPATPTGTGAGSSPSSLTIGAGAQQLVLRISEDAYQGDAQYTVSVDGHQVGGTQTAHSLHAAGQSGIVTVLGDWATGDHTVSINFLNDAWGFTFDTDRNLYLDGASYGGAPIANSHLAFMGAGPQEFDFHLGSPTPATPTSPVLPATPTGTGAGSSPSSLTIGAGAQQLVLRISEDAYQGDARYTVSVDGHQIGGTQTAHSLHAAGQSDIVTVLGDWGTGDHTVSINFLNDAWGFTFDTDRNLYLDGASYGAAPIANSHLAFMGIGPQEFDFHLL